jgi:acetyl esterase/lipase
MRQYIIAGAVAGGLIALWAAVLPLTAEPVTKQAAAKSPMMSEALFLCRRQNGLNHACVRALAKALILDAKPGAPPGSAPRAAKLTNRCSPTWIGATDAF